jgi:hypothetical protein
VSPVGMAVFGFHDLPDSECASKDARWWTHRQIFLLSFMRTRTLSRPSDVGAAIGLRCGHRSHHLKPVPANGANQLQRMSRDTCKTRAIRTRCLASLVVLASSNFRLGGQSFWNLESFWRKICVDNSRLIQPGKGQKWRLSWNIMESWWIMMIIILGIHFSSLRSDLLKSVILPCAECGGGFPSAQMPPQAKGSRGHKLGHHLGVI